MDAQPSQEYQKVATELLRDKMQEAQTFFGRFLTIFSFYLGINGALVKFALDRESTPQLTTQLANFGIALSVMLLIIDWLVVVYRNALAVEIAGLREWMKGYFEGLPEENPRAILPLPSLQSCLQPMRDAAYVSAGFSVSLGFGWLYIQTLTG